MSALIQNAVRVKRAKDWLYLRSSHVHEFIAHGRGKKRFHIDGGLAYLKRGYVGLINEMPFEEWSLNADDPFDLIAARLLWGSYPNGPKGARVIKPLAQCDLSHLRAIRETQKLTGHYALVVDYWIGLKSALSEDYGETKT